MGFRGQSHGELGIEEAIATGSRTVYFLPLLLDNGILFQTILIIYVYNK